MNILIRLPNWLGDMVMSSAFVQAVHDQYPGSSVGLIAKKGIAELLDLFPPHEERYIFSKAEYNRLTGSWRFGKRIGRKKKYDLFFSLPDSFSSAVMGYASGAKKRVGFRKEGRNIFLTSSYLKRKNLHRMEEYLNLLEQYTGKKTLSQPVKLSSTGKVKRGEMIVININSEAPSRRLPESKAISLINAVRKNCEATIFLVGGPNDIPFVDLVYQKLESRTDIVAIAGLTPMIELAGFLEAASVVLTTDSGPAHLANALGTHTIVLFGAGNENNTAPYNKDNRTIIRLNRLSCEPCLNNVCKLYDQPECLLQLDEGLIVEEVQAVLKQYISYP